MREREPCTPSCPSTALLCACTGLVDERSKPGDVGNRREPSQGVSSRLMQARSEEAVNSEARAERAGEWMGVGKHLKAVSMDAQERPRSVFGE